MRSLQESGSLQEVDIDKTDELPVLDMATYEAAVRDNHATVRVNLNATTVDPDRYPNVDLPSLIESVQNAEARIAQQSVQYEVIERELKQARDQAEEAARAVQRLSDETVVLRDTLHSREETLAQTMQTVGERDRQLNEIRHDYTTLTGKLEHTAATATTLDADLTTARSQISHVQSAHQSSQVAIAELTSKIKRGDEALDRAQREALRFKNDSTAYLEKLRSREWRRGNSENQFRELDSQIATALASSAKFEQQAKSLSEKIESANMQLAERDARVRALETSVESASQSAKSQAQALQDSEQSRQELLLQIRAKDAAQNKSDLERASLNDQLGALERTLKEQRDLHAQSTAAVAVLESTRSTHLTRIAELEDGVAQAQRVKLSDDERHQKTLEDLSAAKAEIAEHLHQMSKLDAELEAATSLLNETRRPIDLAEAEILSLRQALDAKAKAVDNAEDEIKALQAALERARGAAEEREFLIRRLERSATNNANVLGRLQTSIERLGAPAQLGAPGTAPVPANEVNLTRIDSGFSTTYALSSRTRIGRSPESDIRIDSTAVSRHHALIVIGARHAIIEDLNSTNGVIVNGRKVSRYKLKDGDVLTIGEAQFKLTDTGTLLPDANPVSFAPS